MMNKKQKKMLWRIGIVAVLMISMELLPMLAIEKIVFSMAAYIVIGYDVLRKSWRGILNRRIFDENFLMAVATVGAIVLAVYQQSYDFTEAIAVMLFYQIGELFQSYAVGKSRRNITALMDIRPDYANIEKDGNLEQVDPEEVPIGSVIVIRPGEKLPIDGVVVEGSSDLNTSALTGESLPREVTVGEEVISGCINMTGVLRIQTTKRFEESTVFKILELVEESSSRKSKSEHFISKFARVYTPAVCYSALALAVLPPLVAFIMGQQAGWEVWLYRALTFLVISCPCALVISIPLSFFAGIGGASREGILIKGSNYLETLSKTTQVVFDKTGTLTQGVLEVTGIVQAQIDEKQLLEYVALAECASSHPISKSLQRAYGKELERNRVSEIEEISGFGVQAKVDGKFVLVGNERWMKQHHIPYPERDAVGTIIHVAVEQEYAGCIILSDREKLNAKKDISELKRAGVKHTVMLTGDRRQMAEKVAEKLGIQEVHSELLPADKVAEIEKLLEKMTEKETLAFVGDGINDAPVLSRADIGIAMGALGSDAAIEAADVVLMDDDLLKIAKAIRISKKCIRIVYQNIVFALGIKFLCLALGAVGVANMWFAIFADVGVMVLAVLNAIRTLYVRHL